MSCLDTCLFALLLFNDNLQRGNFIERFKQNKLDGIYEDQYMQIVAKYKENKERPEGERRRRRFMAASRVLS